MSRIEERKQEVLSEFCHEACRSHVADCMPCSVYRKLEFKLDTLIAEVAESAIETLLKKAEGNILYGEFQQFEEWVEMFRNEK